MMTESRDMGIVEFRFSEVSAENYNLSPTKSLIIFANIRF
jgi:hypothetical protein